MRIELILAIIVTASNLHYIYAFEATCSASTSSEEDIRKRRLETLELILADDYEALDPTLPVSIAEIKKRGGHRCWHKHSTFLEHLIGVHNILRLWNESAVVARVGLLHSAYSNSYVNLALFDPKVDTEREIMHAMIGDEAEALVHLFCIIDRQSVVVNTLLAQGFIPEDGLDVPHLRDENVTVHLTSEILRLLVVFTMADVADQFFGWQDSLFGGEEKQNSMLLPGEDDLSQHDSYALWPGSSRPGLWMSYVSQLCAVAKTFRADAELSIGVPPVFNDCSEVLTRENEAKAIDLYWAVITDAVPSNDVIDTLEEATRLNPWFFESYVLLAQKYLHMNDNLKAKEASERALDLQLIWGTAYDKRMSFPAWVAWTRVLHARALNNEGWPSNSWAVNNFGMVK